jgi:hypothetical protein
LTSGPSLLLEARLTPPAQVPDAINSAKPKAKRSLAAMPSLKIRIVSPEQARSTEINAIPTLSDDLPLNSTLGELKSRVQEHLGFPPEDGKCLELECNCKFAQQIYENAILSDRGTEHRVNSNTIIVVHGNNEVIANIVEKPTADAIADAGSEFFLKSSKEHKLIGGIRAISGRYSKLPILAVSSRSKHRSNRGFVAGGDRDLVIDLHTSECPVEVTLHNSGVTLATAGLQDCTIDGVLAIYVVQRWTKTNDGNARQGKAAIFKSSEAWEHPHGQSDRGISNRLSTLRVFAHLTTKGFRPAKSYHCGSRVVYLGVKMQACLILASTRHSKTVVCSHGPMARTPRRLQGPIPHCIVSRFYPAAQRTKLWYSITMLLDPALATLIAETSIKSSRRQSTLSCGTSQLCVAAMPYMWSPLRPPVCIAPGLDT